MANTTEDELWASFQEASGGQAPEGDGLANSNDGLSMALGEVVRVAEEAGATGEATGSDSGTATSSGGGIDAASVAKTVLESGLGIIPLVTGLLGLFGGGSSKQETPLVKYAMPSKMYLEGADIGDTISESDYDQSGMPRLYGAVSDGNGGASRGGTAAAASSGSSGGLASQVTVNVQAMDAQSFLDHSSEIAQAVRQAMLNLSSINDVMTNL